MYDVVVIGSGIAGLVSAAYLAKAGLDVLVLEAREKPGGYCGSFKRDGFTFDDAVHYVNNLGPNGILKAVCDDLGVFKTLDVTKVDPSDRIDMPGLRFSVHSNIQETIRELCALFPSQSMQVESFFREVQHFELSSAYPKYHNKTFQQVLEGFFSESKLIATLGLLSYTLGLPPTRLAGLAGLAYYRGSVLDGGYHLHGGAQSLADALADCITNSGGKIQFMSRVQKLLLKGNAVEGVKLTDGSQIKARLVISNIDATSLFHNLLESDKADQAFLKRIDAMEVSLSNFIVYLGVKRSVVGSLPVCCNYWHFPYSTHQEGSVDITEDDRDDGFIHISFPSLYDRSMAPKDLESIMLFVGASFQSDSYWEKNKQRLEDVVIRRASKVVKHLEDSIVLRFSATPHTLLRYTSNRNGSYRGWAPTLSQTKLGLVPQKTNIGGLILVGHWITTPVGHGGVSMVALSGRNGARTAMRILNKKNKL